MAEKLIIAVGSPTRISTKKGKDMLSFNAYLGVGTELGFLGLSFKIMPDGFLSGPLAGSAGRWWNMMYLSQPVALRLYEAARKTFKGNFSEFFPNDMDPLTATRRIAYSKSTIAKYLPETVKKEETNAKINAKP